MRRTPLLSALLCLSVAVPASAITVTDVVNFGSRDHSFSPGVLATITGTNLVSPLKQVFVTLETFDAGGGLQYAGNCYVLQASSTQLQVQLPVDAPIVSIAQIVVGYLRSSSPPFFITVNPYSPAIVLSQNPLGATGYFFDNNLPNTPSSPAKIGDAIRAYAIGLGSTTPVIGTGVATTGSPTTDALPDVYVGGVKATVTSSTLATGTIGTYQVEFRVPSGVPIGQADTITLIIGGYTAPTASLQVGFTTTTSLTSSAPSVSFGQLVTFTASLDPPAATGSVTFYDGVTMLGAGVIGASVAGAARFTTRLLPSGSRQIQAYYNGDQNNAASLSNSVSQTVVPGKGSGFVSIGSFTTLPTTLMAIGDFNGDGHADLVFADSLFASGVVHVLLGNGDGTFHLPAADFTVFPANQNPFCAAIVVWDYNRDGIADLAVLVGTDSRQMVVYLPGKGDGTFPQAFPINLNYADATVPAINLMTTADINRDGIPDLLFTDANANTVSVLLGGNDLDTGIMTRFPAGRNPFDLVATDFDGDGIVDVAVGTISADSPPAGQLNFLRGDGTGQFTSAAVSTIRGRSGPILTADFNGDGLADVASLDARGQDLAVLRSTPGNPFYFQPADYYFPTYSPYSGLAVGDFDGDGNVDLAVTGLTNQFYILRGLGGGSGQFASAVAYPVTAFLPSAVVVGDFNEDGVADLAIGDLGNYEYNSPSTGVTILLGIPTPTISFDPIDDVILQPNAQATVTLKATASSSLPVTFSSNTPSVCTVNGTQAVISSPGQCSITASQPADATHPAAIPVTRTFGVTSYQNLIYTVPGNVALGAAPFLLSANATSGLPVTLTSNTTSVCTVLGLVVSAVGLGQCSLTASQTGSTLYLPAQITINFTVSTPALNACDANADGSDDAADVQLLINEILGSMRAVHAVSIAALQTVINAALGLGCTL